MDNQKQYSLLMEAFNAVYDNISESHFKVGDEVICKDSGMEGEVIKLDKPDGKEDEKYYTVKREDGKKVKYAPKELKLAEEAKNGGVPRKKEEKFHTKLDTLVHKTFGKREDEMKEEVDIFDVILEHLVAEGYADTNQAALAIMANMSEEWRESIMIEEGMTMKDFKANRRKLKRREASADAKKRGHVGKEWYNSGRTYSPDEAKRMRSNLDDEERSTRHRSSVDPEGDDSDYSANITKNPKKLRKQTAMGEH